MHINVAHFIRCHPSIRWWKIIFLLSLTLFALSLFRKCVTILHCKRAKKIFLLYLVGFAFCVLARGISATRAISYASKAQSNLLNRLFVKDGAGIEKIWISWQRDFHIRYASNAMCQLPSKPIVTLAFHFFFAHFSKVRKKLLTFDSCF